MGQRITEFFDIVRPIIEFKFEIVLARSNNIFEIATVEPLEVLQKVSTMIVSCDTFKNGLPIRIYDGLEQAGKDGKGDEEDAKSASMMDINLEEEDKSLHLKVGQIIFITINLF